MQCGITIAQCRNVGPTFLGLFSQKGGDHLFGCPVHAPRGPPPKKVGATFLGGDRRQLRFLWRLLKMRRENLSLNRALLFGVPAMMAAGQVGLYLLTQGGAPAPVRGVGAQLALRQGLASFAS